MVREECEALQGFQSFNQLLRPQSLSVITKLPFLGKCPHHSVHPPPNNQHGVSSRQCTVLRRPGHPAAALHRPQSGHSCKPLPEQPGAQCIASAMGSTASE